MKIQTAASDGLRISELASKHRPFWPFLGDLRRGRRPSNDMILLNTHPRLRKAKNA